MPSGSTGPKFELESNFKAFSWELVDSIYSGPKKKMGKSLVKERGREREREREMKFCIKLPLGSSSQEFLPVFYGGFFAWNFIDSIYRGPRIEM